jgi:Ca-activated chloride channel homolog
VSKATLRQAIEMALRAEATIFAISITRGGFFGIGEEKPEGDEVLTELVKSTGGQIYHPIKVEDLDENFRRINQELRSQYSLGYYSTNTAKDGSYRRIDIKVSEKGLKLSHRKGYYAPTN